jgi:rhamnulokinase
VKFSRKALRHFGIPEDWFRKPTCAPAPAGTVLGIPGLEKVRVIRVPGHDTSCAYDAMPSDDPGDLYLSSGTWSLMGFVADGPVADKHAFAESICNERLGDGRWRPLKTCLGLWLLEQTLPAFHARPESAADWDALITAAEAAPPPAGLLDTTDRSLFNPASMRGAIDAQLKAAGLKPPADLPGYVRLICASLGAGHGRFKRAFEKITGRKFRRILMVGGGSRNRLLCQSTADQAGVPVVSYSLEGTAVGNIANQLVALGVFGSLKEFRAQLAGQLESVTYTPRK